MACPHTTGVVAQQMQKVAEIKAKDIRGSITCDASENLIHFNPLDTISRNLLLQTPSHASVTCSLGEGCENMCSGRGICLPPYRSSAFEVCHCDIGKYGDDCSYDRDPACNQAAGSAHLSVDMLDSYGDGWTFSSYAIIDLNSGLIVDNAFDSLCYGDEGSHEYCLQPGCYGFEVTKGYGANEVQWNFCNEIGGAPFTGTFCIENSRCSFTCDENREVGIPLTLTDSYGDGWNGAYYDIYSDMGESLFGGTMIDGQEEVHNVCLLKGSCYYVFFEAAGTDPREVGFSMCNTDIQTDDVAKVCIDPSTGICRVDIITTPPDTFTCNDYPITVVMIDHRLQGTSSRIQLYRSIITLFIVHAYVTLYN